MEDKKDKFILDNERRNSYNKYMYIIRRKNMKLLHLADLHIGKIIYDQSLLEDQEYMLKEIVKIAEKEKVDAVLISGDIYDRSVPPADAVDVLNEFLNKLIRILKIKVFMISGNHDSKERLNFGSKIFENDGLYIQTNYDGKIKCVELSDEVNIYMLPFVKPVEVKQYFENETIDNYNEAIKLIINNEEIDENKVNILMAHQFVTAGSNSPETCESETINVGGVENIDSSNFDKFDYVALGHIHGPQRIGKDTIRYSGTMLKYSFSEANHNKSVVLINIKNDKSVEYQLIPLKPLRDMRVIKGPIEELLKEENYKDTNTNDYIKAIVTNKEPIYDAIGQLRRVYPNTLSLEISNVKTSIQNVELENIEKLKQKDEFELFDDFYEFQNNIRLDDEQRKIIKDIIEQSKNEK